MSLKEKALALPTTSGCYIMKNEKQEILYIGKAKNLKRRVSSYFNKLDREKIKRLMYQVTTFDILHTKSEEAALILEAALIMHYQPYYNRALKEERKYFSISITKEKNPQLLLARTTTQPLLYSFGPFPSRFLAEELYHYLERSYPLSKCQRNVGHPCMYVELGLCLGGCYRDIPEKEYQKALAPVLSFLSLSYSDMYKRIQKEQALLIEQLAFEKAELLQLLIEWLKRYVDKPKVAINGHVNFDYLTEWETQEFSVFYMQRIRNQCVISSDWWVADGQGTEEEKASTIESYYSRIDRQLPIALFVKEKWHQLLKEKIPSLTLAENKHTESFEAKAQEKAQIIYQVQCLFKKYTQTYPRYLKQN